MIMHPTRSPITAIAPVRRALVVPMLRVPAAAAHLTHSVGAPLSVTITITASVTVLRIIVAARMMLLRAPARTTVCCKLRPLRPVAAPAAVLVVLAAPAAVMLVLLMRLVRLVAVALTLVTRGRLVAAVVTGGGRGRVLLQLLLFIAAAEPAPLL